MKLDKNGKMLLQSVEKDDVGKWYTIEQVMQRLFGRILKPQMLDFEGAWDKEYYFANGELDRTKKEFGDARKKHQASLTIDGRNIGTLVSKKRFKGESRKKEIASIKFIKGEI